MKCPPRGEEFVESTYKRKTGHQVEGWGCHPTVKNYDPELLLSERTLALTMGKRLLGRDCKRTRCSQDSILEELDLIYLSRLGF